MAQVEHRKASAPRDVLARFICVPAAQSGAATSDCVARTLVGCASRRSAPLGLSRDAQRIQTKLGRGTRRENDFVFRHCEAKGRLRPSSTGYGDEAIQNLVTQKTGLLRFACNDEGAERVRGLFRDLSRAVTPLTSTLLPLCGERGRASPNKAPVQTLCAFIR